MNALRLVFQSIVFAIKQIFSHKIRSLLTTLGVIIGVSAVLAVVAALSGLRQGILDEFESFGVKRVFIDGTRPRELRNKISWRDVQLTVDEVEAIVDRCPSITEISPIYRVNGAIEYNDMKLEVGATGIWPQWHDIENRQIILGRPFNSIDEAERSSVCVVNDKAVEELLLPTDPIGEIVLIAERRFKIVGVVETIQTSGMFGGGDSSAEVYMPFATAQNLNPDGWVNMAWARSSQRTMWKMQRQRSAPCCDRCEISVQTIRIPLILVSSSSSSTSSSASQRASLLQHRALSASRCLSAVSVS